MPLYSSLYGSRGFRMATTVQLRMNASFWLDGNVRITAQFIEGMMTSIRELHGATII